MAERRRMYLGTEHGIVALTGDDHHWEFERTMLEGVQVYKMVAPAGAGILYAHARDGVHVSSDDGRSWDRVFPSDAFYIAVDPSNPKSLYVGTEPVHLYRTVDAGDSWEELESLAQQPESIRDKWWFPVYPHDSHVKTIYVDPRSRGRVYVGLEHGGILRTDDGGKSWEEVSDGIEYLDIHMVGGDPAQENVVYAATARGFYRSDDYGHDWILAEEGLDRDDFHAFAAQPGPCTSLFLTATRGTPPSWVRPSGAEGAVFRSEDSGLTWQQLGGGLPENLKRAPEFLAVDPLDEARLYVSASDHQDRLPEGIQAGGEVWVTADRGAIWSQVYEAKQPIRILCVGAV